jgi:ribonuclease PH
MRSYNRELNQSRPCKIETGFNKYAEGSALIEMGETRVMCLCSVEEKVPHFKVDSGEGWVDAEYAMLPRATSSRNTREAVKGQQQGRTVEIGRLIGRALRAVVDFKALDGYTLTVDCDVLQADGGTRTASITGAYVALAMACKGLVDDGRIERNPLSDYVAAISLGVINGDVHVDLDYSEDYGAEVDLNLIMTGDGNLVEIQGTAEKVAFPQSTLLEMLDAGGDAIAELVEIQKKALENL